MEAQAAGRPVIAYGAGGVLDSVLPLPRAGRHESTLQGLDEAPPATGIFFERQTPEALETALERFEKAEFQFRPAALRAWAERFSPAHFDAALDREIALLGGVRA